MLPLLLLLLAAAHGLRESVLWGGLHGVTPSPKWARGDRGEGG